MKIIDLHFNLDFVLFKPVFSQNKKKSNFLNFIEADSKAWCYFLVGQTVIRRYVVHICFIIDLEFVQKLLIKIIYVIKGDNFSIDLSFIDLFADSFISVSNPELYFDIVWILTCFFNSSHYHSNLYTTLIHLNA